MAENVPLDHPSAKSNAADHQLAIIQVKKNIAVTLALVLRVINLAKKFWGNVVTCVLLHVMIKR